MIISTFIILASLHSSRPESISCYLVGQKIVACNIQNTKPIELYCDPGESFIELFYKDTQTSFCSSQEISSHHSRLPECTFKSKDVCRSGTSTCFPGNTIDTAFFRNFLHDRKWDSLRIKKNIATFSGDTIESFATIKKAHLQPRSTNKPCGVVVGLASHCKNFCIDTMLTTKSANSNRPLLLPFRSTNQNLLLGDSVCIDGIAGKRRESTVKNVTSPNSQWTNSDSLFGFEFALLSGGKSVSQNARMTKTLSPNSGRFGVAASLDSWNACKKRESCQFSLNFDGDSGRLSGNCQATWIDSSITPSAKFLFRLDDRSPFPRKIISGNDTLVIRKTLHPPQ